MGYGRISTNFGSGAGRGDKLAGIFPSVWTRGSARPNPCLFIVLAHCAFPQVPEPVAIDTHADPGVNASFGKSSSTMRKKEGCPICHQFEAF